MLMVTKFTVDMSTCTPLNLITISVSFQILLFIGYPILLGGFKLEYEVLDLSLLGAIFFGNGTDADFILDDSH